MPKTQKESRTPRLTKENPKQTWSSRQGCDSERKKKIRQPRSCFKVKQRHQELPLGHHTNTHCWPTTVALKAIELEGGKYGLKLNRSTCEMLRFDHTKAIQFQAGTIVEVKDKVNYLVVSMNRKADPAREVQKN